MYVQCAVQVPALRLMVPMALLFGILFGLGRLSADREFVAMQACGISVFRVFRPIVLLAVLACGATAYETIVALPSANQTFRGSVVMGHVLQGALRCKVVDHQQRILGVECQHFECISGR